MNFKLKSAKINSNGNLLENSLLNLREMLWRGKSQRFFDRYRKNTVQIKIVAAVAMGHPLISGLSDGGIVEST